MDCRGPSCACPGHRREEHAASGARAEAGRGAGTSGSPTLARRPPARMLAGMAPPSRLQPSRRPSNPRRMRCKKTAFTYWFCRIYVLVCFCSSIGSLVWHSQALWPPAIQAALKGQFSSFQHLFLRCASCLTGLHSHQPGPPPTRWGPARRSARAASGKRCPRRGRTQGGVVLNPRRASPKVTAQAPPKVAN